MKEIQLIRFFWQEKSILRFLTIICCLMISIYASAQSQNISGKVIDQNGEAIIGASVVISGTSNGTITDMEGKFTLHNVPKKGNLEIRFVGYVSQTMPLGKTTFNITLEENKQALEEVVVVGYGVQKKSDVTGAMARIGEKELQAMPVQNAMQAMQGKTAGVDITSNQRPGEVGTIRVRGVRSLNASQNPLYVVDGMVIQAEGINAINPNDIESIDVLKDASATAIYGSRGANGVILITTKQGKRGKMSLNYSTSVTFENMKDVTKYMNTSEWLDYARLAKYNMGTYASSAASYSADYATWGSVSASFANIEKGWQSDDTEWDGSKSGNFDWGKYGKQTGVSTEHTLSVSGGTDKFRGYGSIGFLRQAGTIPGQLYKRYSSKTSFEANPIPAFKMGTSANVSWGDQDYGYSYAKSTTGAGDLYSALKGMLPWTVPYDENGDYIRNPAAGDVNIINPINELKYTINTRQTLSASGSLFMEFDLGKIWQPLEGLRFRNQFGPEFQYYRTGTFYDENGINGDGNNIASYNQYTTLAWTLDNLLYYDKTFKKDHKISLTLMHSSSAYHYEYSKMTATGVASESELWYNLYSAGSLSSFGSGLTEKQMESYMSRINYGFKDRYLLTASIRWDGASQLADGHKWAAFPSAALAWRADQEDFLRNIQWLSALKVRLGFGVTGNSAIDAYATKGAITSLYYNYGSTSSTLGYVASDPSQASPAMMANNDLTWERTKQYNLGIDYGFLNGHINGSIDLFRTETSDLLMEMSIPSLTGYTSTYANVGKTSGWGIDLQINTINVDTRNFKWETSLTWSTDRSNIKELANGSTEDLSNLWFVGKPIGVYYDYVYDGIWKTSEEETAATFGRKPGQIKVKDLNGDGVIDANNDKKIIGSSRPDWTGGISNTFSYKNLELSFFIYSRWGGLFKNGALTLDGRYQQRKIDYWIADVNENAKYYSPGSNGESADTYSSSMNYQDGTFIKLRNINLGYNFSSKQLSKTGLSTLKIYAQCTNPFTIYSKCDYLDTDLSNYDNNTVTVGAPVTIKGFVLGLNIGF